MSDYQSVYDRLPQRGQQVVKIICGLIVSISLIQLLLLKVFGMAVVNKWYMLILGSIVGILFIVSSVDMFLKWQFESDE